MISVRPASRCEYEKWLLSLLVSFPLMLDMLTQTGKYPRIVLLSPLETSWNDAVYSSNWSLLIAPAGPCPLSLLFLALGC